MFGRTECKRCRQNENLECVIDFWLSEKVITTRSGVPLKTLQFRLLDQRYLSVNGGSHPL